MVLFSVSGCFLIKYISEQYIVLVFMVFMKLSALLIWFLSTEILLNVVVVFVCLFFFCFFFVRKSLSFQVKKYCSWFCQ